MQGIPQRTRIAILGLFLALASGLLPAQQPTISPAMVQQFMSLPAAQQQALASQLGIDISALRSAANSMAAQPDNNMGQPGQQLQQRSSESGQPNPQGLNQQQLEQLRSLLQQDNQPQQDQLQRYGMSLFDAQVSTFAPVDNAPVPANYVLGPGDSLEIMLLGAESSSLSLVVDREGVINFPRLGAIAVAGLSFDEAKQQIETRVAEQLIGVRALVGTGRLRAINLFLAGEVKTPGAYSVSALTTVTQALFVAGGVSDIGSLRNIQVRRSGETLATFDLYDLLLRGDSSNDLRLQSGDVVFVPPYEALATIEGAVRRPAIYELVPGDTLADLVQMAGRFQSNAFTRMVTLQRYNQDAALPELLNLDLSAQSGQQMALRDGDHLVVPVTADTFSNGVRIKGAVVRPGAYAWREGVRVSDLLPSITTHLNLNVDLDYALVVSIKNARLDIEVKAFNLGQAIANPGSNDDPLLSPRDEILVFNLPAVADEAEAGLQTDRALNQIQALQNRQNLLAATAGNASLAGGVVAAGDEAMGQQPEGDAQTDNPTDRASLLEPVIQRLRLQARENEPVQVVSISGAVKAPGEYPLNQGDTLSVLIRAAGGLNDNAFLGEAELQRVVVDQAGVADIQIRNLNLSQRTSDANNNPLLQSRDHVFVRTIPDWTPNRRVEVAGEVRFPGTYLIGPNETLAAVIQRAGGLTPGGFADGAVFTRESARERQREQLLDYVDEIRRNVAVKAFTQEAQNVDVGSLDSIIAQLLDHQPQGRLIVDLPRALAGDASADIVLQDGDAVTIPRTTSSVSVIGEVRRSGVYRFESSYAVQDYLELSAGVTDRADDDSIYVVKANGSVSRVKRSLFSFQPSTTGLQAGDTIVVPVNTEYRDTIGYWSTVTQIMYQTGIAIAALVSI